MPVRGEAVQVDPITSTLKAPGTERLKLKYEELLTNYGFKFTLRRCIVAHESVRETVNFTCDARRAISAIAADFPRVDFAVGVDTRPLFGST